MHWVLATWRLLRTGSHGSQSEAPSRLRSICAILAVECTVVGTYHFTQVPSPKYDMDANMAPLFGGEAVEQRTKLDSQHMSEKFIYIK